ncbi:Uma2 family endonuclease [Bradyrhizobium ontarionense]|uniref:Uma2 family endonuclease n=1 Tax=Bradyrhizobium ontarionense TaxID=2898149 RepID=A0ABY3R2R9_9BRAD|nr:Uma2 family endonuclease [Bradyrhizobium sp. A19]UFZ01513.1 Uma2 family endonuclease [Bradyrhizobium sp. A19]
MQIEVHGRGSGRMSASEFRSFQARRPDRERWELVGGVAMMMTPPTIAHNQIASNLERLLNDALARHAPAWLATQWPGLDLGTGDFRPGPDVGVIDADYDAGQRFVDKAYLLAEIVFDTDEVIVPGTDRRWIEVKRELYRTHPHCRAVLVIAQDRMEVALDLKVDGAWTSILLQGREAELLLHEFGLSCRVADLYERTPVPRT